MLARVDSNDPNDTDVGYAYRGDLKRAWRTEDAAIETRYNWDAGFNVLTEDDGAGALTRTYIAGLAEIVGPKPATGRRVNSR